MIHDYGVFKLYGNKNQNANAISSIQKLTGGTGKWGPQNQAAYTNYTSGLGALPSTPSYARLPGEDAFYDGYHTKSKSGSFPNSIGEPMSQAYGNDSSSVAMLSANPVVGSAGGKVPVDNSSIFSDFKSYLPSGWGDGHSNNDIFNTKPSDNSGQWMKSGMITDKPVSLSDASSKAEAAQWGLVTDSTDAQLAEAHKNQGYLDNNTFNVNAGIGLGAAQFATSLYSTFGPNGSMAMNKKNIELMDQQIANNSAEMKNRAGYRDTIAKVFG